MTPYLHGSRNLATRGLLLLLDERMGQHDNSVTVMKIRNAKLAGFQFKKGASEASESIRSGNSAIFKEQRKQAVERVLKVLAALDNRVEREDI